MSQSSDLGASPSVASSSSLAFAHRDFRLFFGSRVISFLAAQMQAIAVAWQIYDTTHRPIDLGYVGLAQFLPAFGLSLWAGQIADRINRRTIIVVCLIGQAAVMGALFVYTLRPLDHVWPIYALLVLLGSTRALSAPASQAILPELVPPAAFANAVALTSAGREAATVVGPAIGGALCIWGAALPLGCAALAAVLGLILMSLVRGEAEQSRHRAALGRSGGSILAGLRHVWREKVVLGVMTLDLFAVLLGGAVALLPVYARDILHIGPSGLGILRSAPGVGAACMGVLIARRPLTRRAGATMLGSVGVFGVATLVFGLSRNVMLSLAALFVMGAFDMVSVIIRATVVQLATPAPLRGRVSAVNMLSITASNQLGELESGLTAEWFGTVPAVIVGGVGSCLVVLLWALWFPALRRIDRMEDAMRLGEIDSDKPEERDTR